MSSKNHLISIIIPVLNEEDLVIPQHTAIHKASTSDGILEIIYVDGGSDDHTAIRTEELNARILMSPKGRARQMNLGAREARGSVLYFLHADTLLPENFEKRVLSAAGREGFGAGAFYLGIDSDKRGLRFIERVANWRAKLLKMPYGDQALFVSRDLFNQIGGFADYPIMEDFDLVRRLRKITNITILPDPVKTSPRRWQNLGVFHTWILNQLIIAAFYMGIPPRRLALWYRREKGKK